MFFFLFFVTAKTVLSAENTDVLINYAVTGSIAGAIATCA